MKTRILIEKLQQADPSGELECCVHNVDIMDVAVLPAYYDGALQVLKRDDSNPYYNVVGAKYTSIGKKVVIFPLSIEDAIDNQWDIPVEYEGMSDQTRAYYEKQVEDWREETRRIDKEIEEENNRDTGKN